MKKLTKKDVIEKVANHFNIGNRSVNCHRRCIYANGCGVAIFLKDSVDKPALDREVPNSINGLYSSGTISWNDFKENVNHIQDVRFWSSIQKFHDSVMNWNETGLSEFGKAKKEGLLKKFA